MPTFTVPPTIDRTKPSVALASSLHYFAGGIVSDANHTALENAQRYAKQMHVIIGQFDKFGTGASLADDMAAANPTLVMGPYHKSAPNERPLSYGLPDKYYAHNATGGKIQVFGGSAYLMQPDGSATFTDPRGFVAATYNEWNALDQWSDIDSTNAALSGDPFQLAYLDSMSIGANGAVKPGTKTAYTDAEFHTLAYRLGDGTRAKATRVWGSGLVFANGLTDGTRYYASVGDLINHVDGGVFESWLRGNGDAPGAWKSEADWLTDLRAVIDVQAAGKYAWTVVNINNSTAGGSGFTPTAFTNAQVNQWKAYAAASHLIANNGKALFEFVESVATKPWDEATSSLIYSATLGLPLDYNPGPAGYKLNGVYQRRFEKGIALVNPTGTDVTLTTLDRAYLQLSPAGGGGTTTAPDDPPPYVSPDTTGWTHLPLTDATTTVNWTTDSKTLTLADNTNYVLDAPNRMHMGSITVHPGTNSKVLIRGLYKSIGLTGSSNPRGAGQDPSPCASTTGQDSGASNLTIDDNGKTGATVWIEGMHIDGGAGPISPAWGYPVEQDGLRLQCPNTKVWGKNIRIERLIGGIDPPHRHADCIQTDGGYRELHLEDCYFDSHYNNLYFRRENDPLTNGIPGKLFVKNVECGGYATNPSSTPTGTNRTPGGTPATLRAISLGTQPIPPSDNTSAVNSKLSHGVWLKGFYATPPAGTSFGHFVHPSTGDGNVAGRPTVSPDGKTLSWALWATNSYPPADETTPSTSTTIGSGDAKVYGVVTLGPAPAALAPANKVGRNFTAPFSNLSGTTQAATGTPLSDTTANALATALNAGQPGQEFNIAAGEYRCTTVIAPKADMKILGAGGDSTIINYSLLLNGFTGTGPYTWSGTVPGPTTVTQFPTPATNALYPWQSWMEQVYMDKLPLWKCGTRVGGVLYGSATPAAGEVFIDYDNGQIKVGSNPAGHVLECTRPQSAITSTVANVEVAGVQVFGCSNIGIQPKGANWHIHHNRIKGNRIGVSVTGIPSQVDHNIIEYNSQYGLNGDGDGSVVEDNEIAHNDHAKLYNAAGANFAAGGMKFTNMLTFTFRRNNVHHNEGSSVWLDINNQGVEISDNDIHDNVGNAIHYEISYAGQILRNYIWNNTLDGIWLSTSRDVVVQGNKIWGNGRFQYRVLDAHRTEAQLNAVPHRGINNTFGGTNPGEANEVWFDVVGSSAGVQVNSPDGPEWGTTNHWINNINHLPPTGNYFVWNGSQTTAQWIALGNDTVNDAAHYPGLTGGNAKPAPRYSSPTMSSQFGSGGGSTSSVTLPLVVKAHTGLVFTTTDVIVAGAPKTNIPTPVVSGTPVVGQTLHVSQGVWTGTQPITFAYQWQRDGVNINDTAHGSNTADYVLQAADATHNVRAIVTATNADGTLTYATGTVSVAASGSVGPVNTIAPSITGGGYITGLLTADPGAWTTSGTVTTTYQWERWSIDGATHGAITGATNPTYQPSDLDVGQNVVVKVTVTDANGSQFARSGPVGPITGEPLPSNTVLPSISGTLRVNSSLLANPGTWQQQGLTYTYQWQRLKTDGTRTDLATTRGYVPVVADVDNQLVVQVTAHTTGGSTTTVESAPSAPVRPFVEGGGGGDPGGGGGGDTDRDLVGRRKLGPVVVEWLMVAFNRSGVPIGPIIGARGRKLTVSLNDHDKLEFSLLLEHRLAPLILPLQTTVKLWRRIPGQPISSALPDFCGIVAPQEEDGESDLSTWTVYSPTWLLEDRFVWEHLKNGLPFKGERKNTTGRDQAEILLNLLDYTNQRGPTGIVGGNYTATALRTREYDIGQNIWQAFTDITSTLGGVDMRPVYVHQDGSPDLMQLGFVPARGTFLQNVRFDYRTGRRNLQNLRRRRVVETGQAPHNFIFVKGQGDQHAAPTAARFDDLSINQLGLREKFIEEDNIQTARALASIAQSYVDAEKYVPVVLEATLSPAKPPYYGEFMVGDGVHISGKRGSLQVDRNERIYQAVVAVSDDTGLESTTMTLADDVDGLVIASPTS